MDGLRQPTQVDGQQVTPTGFNKLPGDVLRLISEQVKKS